MNGMEQLSILLFHIYGNNVNNPGTFEDVGVHFLSRLVRLVNVYRTKTVLQQCNASLNNFNFSMTMKLPS